ncbi:MAG: ABC transporter permease [Lachnospiraceae bacterium]
MILLLLLLLSFLMMTPYRMADTLESHEFVTYMGSPLCDVLLEVEEGEELEERTEAARELLNDQSMQGKISRFEMLRRIRLQSYDNEGNLVGLHIDTGSTAGQGLKYLSGKNPKKDTEIALSSLMAEELDKTVGDKMILLSDKTEKECTVSGIYQDVTSGGRTSKMICEFPQEAAEKYTFQIQMSENADVLRMIENWRERLGSGYSIERMEEFLKQTLGGVSAQVKQACLTVIILALCLAGLIVFLFMKLRIAKEMGMLATKRAMGISMRDIFLQELYPVLLSGGSGVLIGVILTEYAGEFIVSALFGLLGIGLDRIEFSSIPVAEVVGLSIALLMVPIAMVYLSCRELRKMNVTDYLNEE